MRRLLRQSTVLLWITIATGLSLPACRSAAAAPEHRTPIGRDVVLTSQTVVVRSLVPPQATLDALLQGQGVAAETVAPIIGSIRTVFDPRRLRSNHPFVLERSTTGALRSFEYEIDADSLLRVESRGGDPVALAATIQPIPKTTERATIAAAIDERSSSLFAAIEATGESDDLAIALAQIFAGEIDFNSDIQRNDRFVLTFDRVHRPDRPDTHGAVLAAEITNQGRVFRAVRFTPDDGKPAYYDEQGRSLRRFFLKSPLEFEPRVTSGFSMSRMHPVLHVSRAHRGVDYGAPTGAPVIAVAPGIVVAASYDPANGRMVRIRHASGYESYYLHLSAFGKGIRAGVRVDQGQRVGFVGSSGLATGPHLHYGLTRNGTFVNPLTEHRNMPPGEPVPASAMAAFNAVRDQALASLTAATSTN
jgi:murein DD-endopeptidase MepM/ murein hydrolase activator NlpD